MRRGGRGVVAARKRFFCDETICAKLDEACAKKKKK